MPDEPDLRFDDPGSWFTCSGTLLDDHVVLTAGQLPVRDRRRRLDDGEYRVDQPDDLAFLASFGVTP